MNRTIRGAEATIAARIRNCACDGPQQITRLTMGLLDPPRPAAGSEPYGA